MKKIIRKNLGIKLLGAVNCLALCLTEPEEVKKMRKF